MVKSIYLCPRCDYQTINKPDMRRHFQRKRVCADRNNIELTENIKETVLRNFTYHIPKVDNGKSVNNFNMMLGILNGMENLDKVKLLMDHQQSNLRDFEDDTEQRYQHLVQRLEDNAPSVGYLLSLDDLFNIVNNCTYRDLEKGESFNIFFDKVINRLKLFRCRTWESFLEEAGIKQLVSLIKSYYLDSYEIYLIKNLNGRQNININRWQFKEHLIIYYQFLAVFDLEPYVTQFSDVELVGHQIKEEQTNHLAQYYLKLYNEQKKELKESESKNIKKVILGIVKDNSVQNVKSLDRTIIDLLKIDENFRNTLVNTRVLI